MNRREFIYSAGAASLLSGCRTSLLFASPDLRFGVVSDIHVTTRKSCRLLERSFRYFRRRGVDAVMPRGHRVFDYEIRAVPKDGSQPLVKRFLSPASPKHVKYEPKCQRFWFDVAELPQDKDYVLEVRAFNCFGKSGVPLVSPVLRGKPGLATVRKDKETK